MLHFTRTIQGIGSARVLKPVKPSVQPGWNRGVTNMGGVCIYNIHIVEPIWVEPNRGVTNMGGVCIYNIHEVEPI